MSHLYDKESSRVVQAYNSGVEMGHCAYIDYLENELTKSRQKIKQLEQEKAELIETLERWNKSFANTLSRQEYQVEIFNLLNERHIESKKLIEKLNS